MASGQVDVYTQGLAGDRRIDGLVDVEPHRDVDPGSWLVGCGCLLRIEAYCVLACPPALPLHSVLLLAIAFQVMVPLSLTVCVLSCVFAALGGFAPVALPGLSPLAFSLHDPGHPV